MLFLSIQQHSNKEMIGNSWDLLKDFIYFFLISKISF